MKKEKKLNDIYMQEVIKKKIKVIKNNELYAYITFKEILETSHKCTTFINGERRIIVDNKYTIMEYSPINKFYNVRLFIDNKGNIIEYYFDIILESIYKNEQIYYDDLYLDIVYDTKIATGSDDMISLVDEDDLISALHEGKITQKEYEFAYKVAIDLMNEIKTGSNEFINRGIKDYLEYK